MKILTKEEILNLSDDLLPMMVLSDNLYSWLALKIRQHQKGYYNHFMWMHRTGFFASQDFFFKEIPATKYLKGKHRLKFWMNLKWTQADRELIKMAIQKDLEKPKLKTRYDWIQIIGILLGLRKLNIPGIRICSDYIDYLKLVDENYDLKKHPSPPEINRWLKGREGYQVYGRFLID